MNLEKSIFTLLKFNKGLFKSEKQGAFLTSAFAEIGNNFEGGSVYGNSYSRTISFDEVGVLKIVQFNNKSGKDKVVFDRNDPASVAVRDHNSAVRVEARAVIAANAHIDSIIDYRVSSLTAMKEAANTSTVEAARNNDLAGAEKFAIAWGRITKLIEAAKEMNDIKINPF